MSGMLWTLWTANWRAVRPNWKCWWRSLQGMLIIWTKLRKMSAVCWVSPRRWPFCRYHHILFKFDRTWSLKPLSCVNWLYIFFFKNSLNLNVIVSLLLRRCGTVHIFAVKQTIAQVPVHLPQLLIKNILISVLGWILAFPGLVQPACSNKLWPLHPTAQPGLQEGEGSSGLSRCAEGAPDRDD